jgi:hypothetical protein
MLWDHQSADGSDFDALKNWLDAGPIGKAREQARLCAGLHFDQRSSETVILYRDGTGVIVANPNSSYGYLYVAAWLHNGEPEKQPPSGTPDLTHKMNNKLRRRKC